MSSISFDSSQVLNATAAPVAPPAPRGSIYKQMGMALQSMGYSKDQIADMQTKLQTALSSAASSVASGADRASAFRGAMDGVLSQAGVNLDAFRDAMDPENATNSTGTVASAEVDSATITPVNDQPPPRPTAFDKNVNSALTSLGVSSDQIATIQKQIRGALVDAGRAVANGADRATAFRNAIENVLKQNNIDPDKFRAAMSADDQQPTSPTSPTTQTTDGAQGASSCGSQAGATTQATTTSSTTTKPRENAFDKAAAAALSKLGLSPDQITKFQSDVKTALSQAAATPSSDASDRGATYRNAIESVLKQFGITGDQFRQAMSSTHSHDKSRHARSATQGAPLNAFAAGKPPVLRADPTRDNATASAVAGTNETAE
jgi:Holliday junction resolvasome RuvABC DNA-binding subunit